MITLDTLRLNIQTEMGFSGILPFWKKKKQTHLKNLVFRKEHVLTGFFYWNIVNSFMLILNDSWLCTDDSLLHPAHKSCWMNSLENFCIQLFQRHTTVISEESQKDKNLLFALICDTQLKYALTWPTVTFLFNFSTAEPADTTPLFPLCMYILTYHFHTHTIVYGFVYLKYFSYLIRVHAHTHTHILCISGWCQHIHSISICNSELIILSVFYILTWIWYFYLKLDIVYGCIKLFWW
jgi:hypothetical protein